jgi:hypothetical protein
MVESCLPNSRNFPDALYQRHQRRDAAPLAGAGESAVSKVLDEISATWRTDLSQLKELEHIDYPTVNQAVRQAKLETSSGWQTIASISLMWW